MRPQHLSLIFVVLAMVIYQTRETTAIFNALSAGTTIGLTANAASIASAGVGLAVAGVIGLGLLALLAKAGGDDGHYGYREEHYGYNDIHHGGYGHDHGHDHGHGHGHDHGHGHQGGSSYSHHRRSARSAKYPQDKKLTKMFSVVSKMDPYGCSLKLVCYLYGIPNRQLTQQEMAVKKLLGGQTDVADIKDPRYAFVTAAMLGEQGFNCEKIYTQCPLSQRQVKTYLNSLEL